MITREQFEVIVQRLDFLKRADDTAISGFRQAVTLARWPAGQRPRPAS